MTEIYFTEYIWDKIRSFIFPLHNNIDENIRKLYKKFDIKKQINSNNLPQYLYKYIDRNIDIIFFDHIRVFELEDKRILLTTSPYAKNIPYKYFLEGWKPIYSIYNTDTKTFYIIKEKRLRKCNK